MKNVALFLFLLCLSGAALSAGPTPGHDAHESFSKPAPRGGSWAFSLENDVLAFADGDQGYTYGINLAYIGEGARDFAVSPLGLQERLDASVGLDIQPRIEQHSIEFGAYGFTPDMIGEKDLILDDRPYASLVYLESTREQVDLQRGVAWISSLSLGVLGLDAVGNFQNSVHGIRGVNQAEGWDNQISEGGELTAKYSIARQHYLDIGRPGLELKTTALASLGYITEASYGISLRAGAIRSGWWSFHPDLAVYGENSIPMLSHSRVAEHYFWAGLIAKARLYNVFLQGQFRDSAHTLDNEELNHFLLEAWLGYTVAFNNGYRVSYVLRGHSSEIREGIGDDKLIWGGLVVSKSF